MRYRNHLRVIQIELIVLMVSKLIIVMRHQKELAGLTIRINYLKVMSNWWDRKPCILNEQDIVFNNSKIGTHGLHQKYLVTCKYRENYPIIGRNYLRNSFQTQLKLHPMKKSLVQLKLQTGNNVKILLLGTLWKNQRSLIKVSTLPDLMMLHLSM